MTDKRVIKKYPNRRLYDSTESRYVTLADIRTLVINNEPLAVLDNQSGENITRSILFQIIAEQEQHGESVISEECLMQIIRTYDGAMPQTVRRYLEKSLGQFLTHQRRVSESLRETVDLERLGELAQIAREHLSQWLEQQKRVLGSLQSRGQRPGVAGDRASQRPQDP
jgi:polyhydroxyalkanoate synthesis repressor PhaR